MSAGYVYLLQPAGHNVYKIGCSVDVKRRTARIQHKLDIPLEIVHQFYAPDYELTEQQLHSEYRRYHLDGDWFALPDWAVAQIKDM